MKLLRVLHVQVPQVDPSLFLDRFAAQLNFGDKTRQVAQTAVRLVQVTTTPLCPTLPAAAAAAAAAAVVCVDVVGAAAFDAAAAAAAFLCILCAASDVRFAVLPLLLLSLLLSPLVLWPFG